MWIAGYQKGQSFNRNLKVIETLKIAQNKYIQIIEAGDEYLVIAHGKDEVRLLTKVTREQLRSRNKEILLEVINNTNISDAQKQEAIDSMIALTDVAERESAAEILLQAKGFEDVVVSITDGQADVVVNMTEIDDAGRAQIEDIVKRKTGISGENIVITPMAEAE